MKLLIQYMAIGGGGFVGATLRYFVATTCGRWFGTNFPVGTFVINATGSLFLGWFLTAVGQRMIVSDATRLAVAVGFVGAYTTFSTFSFETNSLLEDGAMVKAAVNMFGSLICGLLAVRCGIWIASR